MADVLAVRNEFRLQNWMEIIRECEESGLSNREFCFQRGISEKTYYYWLRKLQRSLASSAYNLRQDECKAAAYDLLAFDGMEYGKFSDTRLQDVPVEVFEEYKDRLPVNFRKRAAHYFGVLASGDPDQIMSGVTNQILSEKSEPI